MLIELKFKLTNAGINLVEVAASEYFVTFKVTPVGATNANRIARSLFVLVSRRNNRSSPPHRIVHTLPYIPDTAECGSFYIFCILNQQNAQTGAEFQKY